MHAEKKEDPNNNSPENGAFATRTWVHTRIEPMLTIPLGYGYITNHDEKARPNSRVNVLRMLHNVPCALISRK